MSIIKPTGELRIAECDGEMRDTPYLHSHRDQKFQLQQAWIDVETGARVWKNVPTVWIGDPEWSDGV